MTNEVQLIDAIAEQPTIDAIALPIRNAVVLQMWTSVKDGLPSDEKPVLAYYGFNTNGKFSKMFIGMLCYFVFDPMPHWQHADLGVFVTHWMPLPKPPREDD